MPGDDAEGQIQRLHHRLELRADVAPQGRIDFLVDPLRVKPAMARPAARTTRPASAPARPRLLVNTEIAWGGCSNASRKAHDGPEIHRAKAGRNCTPVSAAPVMSSAITAHPRHGIIPYKCEHRRKPATPPSSVKGIDETTSSADRPKINGIPPSSSRRRRTRAGRSLWPVGKAQAPQPDPCRKRLAFFRRRNKVRQKYRRI